MIARRLVGVIGTPSMLPMAIGLLCALGASAAMALEYGFDRSLLHPTLLTTSQFVLLIAALLVGGDVAVRQGFRGGLERLLPTWTGRIGLPAIAIGGVLELLGPAVGFEFVSVALTLALAVRFNSHLARSMQRPALLFPASFLVVIVVTTLLLMLPASTPRDQPIGLIDAAFTATSATCVTGLVVRDTASGFTPFGQAVVLLAIQLGGLGAMIFGSTLALLFGARMTHRENLTLSAALSEYPAHRINRFVRFIVVTTLVLQAIGMVLIFITMPSLDESLTQRAWQALFHSISAFCNAGFDLTGASMVPLRSTATPYVALMPLIVLGGLGFMVLEDAGPRLWGRVRRRGLGAERRMPTHSRLVLATTVILLLSGAAIIFVSQLGVGELGLGQRLLDALFMSTTARTAGFNTVPMDELTPGSRFAIMVLMLIGGSPGSTAGGMKTVVFAMLVLAVISTIRNRDEVEIFGRSLPDALVKRAATVAFGLLSVVGIATLVLGMSERGIRFEVILFEAISATTTTGLSIGSTGEFSPVGKVTLMAAMFLGRVGPLALVAALVAGGQRQAAYRFPRDTLSLG